MIFLVLLNAIAFAQPQWSSIDKTEAAGKTGRPTLSYQYFRYGNGKAVEQERFERGPEHFEYHFQAPPAPARKVCPIENRPGVYWYTPEGKALNHTFSTPSPAEFRVSDYQTGVRGFGVSAAFSGSAKRTGAVEVAYFADRACSDGSIEYGFSRDLATDSILVYWATFANCGNDAASLCRKTDDGSLGKGYSNVQQEDGGTTANHGFRIYGLQFSHALTYKMSVEGQGFRVEVWNGGQLARCSEMEGGKAAPCTFLKHVEPWFPLDQIGRGYIIAGTQTAGDPQISPGSVFVVSDILVAR
jgi:hypothetical protein